MYNIKKYALVAFSSLILMTNIKAATCGYEEKAKLNNEIANVKANYEIKERIMDPSEYVVPDALTEEEAANYVAKQEYFQINILNLTENITAEVTNNLNNDKLTYDYTTDNKGNISFNQMDLDELITYTIKFYASKNTGCEGSVLKTLYVKMPRYNSYSTYSFCKNIPDYYMCQKYVTYEEKDFDTFYNRVTAEINKKIDKDKSNEENQKWYKKVFGFIKEHKVEFIAGGAVLIIVTGGVTYIIIKKRRRSII